MARCLSEIRVPSAHVTYTHMRAQEVVGELYIRCV